MKKGNVVEILYTGECPFWKETLKMIEEVVNDLKAEIAIKKIRISSEKEAKRYRFLGSPTVRINGVDIDPAAEGVAAGYIGCRIYMYKSGMYEFPPKDMIRTGFERLLRK